MRTEDEINRTVLIRLQNEKIIGISLEERDANELVLVLRGYYRLVTNQNLPVDKEESPPVDDLAPPFLSQHKVVPEKWSYVNQKQMKTICFAMHPIYQNINRKTNGLYNTMGRQSKTPLMIGFNLDSNMNSSMSNKNHQLKNEFGLDTGYDLQSVMSMEILESGLTEAKNEEVLRRVKEMQYVVESSEKYLTEQEELAKNSEWQETSVDIESDNDSIMTEDGGLGSQLKHSDSLLLLTKSCHANAEIRNSFTNAAIEMLRTEINQSESDNDSLYTPHDSPKHNSTQEQNNTNKSRVSFGLHSPDTAINESQELKSYLAQLRETKDVQDLTNMYVFDPDIIDLTLLPPPATPDELDCALPTPINLPPSSFADSMDKLNKLGVLHENLDLEEFLASVTVPPPTQKVTPAVELTPEEIMSYIIPPPPDILETIVNNDDLRYNTTLNNNNNNNNSNGVKRRNSNSSVHSNIIEYATVDRKGAFSCCSKNKTTKMNEIQPLPRRSSDEKPPERPPKNSTQERQRSQSLSSHKTATTSNDCYPPKLPPKGETNHQAPPHLFLPPKKPPLPPVPPIEVLRSRKNMQPPTSKTNNECRTACIGSPHLQRSKNTYNDIDNKFGDTTIVDDGKLNPAAHSSTAISTPTSPHLGIID